jgi:hypothetical protein
VVPYRCKNCAWFDREHKSLAGVVPDLGYCRKHKPVIYQGKDGRYYGGWPLVDECDLCGEFRDGEKGA